MSYPLEEASVPRFLVEINQNAAEATVERCPPHAVSAYSFCVGADIDSRTVVRFSWAPRPSSRTKRRRQLSLIIMRLTLKGGLPKLFLLTRQLLRTRTTEWSDETCQVVHDVPRQIGGVIIAEATWGKLRRPGSLEKRQPTLHWLLANTRQFKLEHRTIPPKAKRQPKRRPIFQHR